jgi:hypothetical protein
MLFGGPLTKNGGKTLWGPAVLLMKIYLEKEVKDKTRKDTKCINRLQRILNGKNFKNY